MGISTLPEETLSPPGTGIDIRLSKLSAHMAAEIAAQLSDADTIRERYGISDAQWEVLRKSPAFRNMVEESLKQFSGDLNATARVKLKSGIALEDTIEDLYQMVKSPDTPAPSRVEAAKFLSRISGADKEINGNDINSAGEGFSISIYIGDSNNDKPVTIQDNKHNPKALTVKGL